MKKEYGYIQLRIKSEEKEYIKQMAKKENKSITEYMLDVLIPERKKLSNKYKEFLRELVS